MSPAGSSQCSVNVLGRAAVLERTVREGGRTSGRDPCGLAVQRTEAALWPGAPGGQPAASDLLILLKWRRPRCVEVFRAGILFIYLFLIENHFFIFNFRSLMSDLELTKML